MIILTFPYERSQNSACPLQRRGALNKQTVACNNVDDDQLNVYIPLDRTSLTKAGNDNQQKKR